MAEQRGTPIAIAILAGSAMIAVALYFGLRSRAGDKRRPASPPKITTQTPQQSRAQAIAALAAIRPKLVRECWAPSRAKTADPPMVKYVVDTTFDATGKQISLGISEQRGFARADVAACLRRQPLELRITPPGRNVRVSITLQLP